MVLGETDIVRQVRDSYALAAANGTTGPRLDALFHEALRVAKRARSEMDVSRGVFSVGGAAADLAGSIFGDLSGRSILLLGAGKMSETTARHLTASGANTVLVANRTRDRALRLAETLGGRAVPFEDLDRHLAIADIVVASTAAPHCILTAERLAPVMRQRRGRDLFLIDIALPRDIEPSCGRIDGVFLYDLDDLQRVVDVESSERGLRARAASLLVEREAEQFLGKVLSAAIATPMVTEFRNKHREIVDDELARLRRRLPGVSEEEWAAIEAFAGSVLNRIAHDPTVRIREYAQARDANRLDTARELLGLGESSGNTKS
jgi:glutamyl-tRNA reductase